MSAPCFSLQFLLGGSHGDKQQAPLSILLTSLSALDRKQVTGRGEGGEREGRRGRLMVCCSLRSVLSAVYMP